MTQKEFLAELVRVSKAAPRDLPLGELVSGFLRELRRETQEAKGMFSDNPDAEKSRELARRYRLMGRKSA